MSSKKKIFLYSGGVLVGLVIILFLIRFITTNQIREKIPDISESPSLKGPVREQIIEVYKTANRNPSSENIGKLGMVYHSSANYAEAAQCYRLAAERKKADWKWNYYFGYLNMEMGNSEAAIENFTFVVEKNPQNYHAWYYLGEEYKNIRDNEISEECYEVITRQNSIPVSNSSTRNDHFSIRTYALFKLARIYSETGRTDLAERTLKNIIESEYLFSPAYRLLGNIYLTNGDEILGKKSITRANDLVAFTAPVDTLADKIALLSRSELYLLKKIDEAERSIHSDWALQLVENGLKYIPENRDLISKALKIFLWKGLNEKAIALIERHLNLFAGEFIEIKNTGMLFYQKNLYPQAATYWGKALELKPGEVIIQLYLAQCLWATGEKQDAEDLLVEMINDNRQNPLVLADVTELLFEFGLKEKANEWFSNLKRQAPKNAKVLRMSGEIAEKNGEITRAFSLYKASLANDPEDLRTIRKLADMFMNQEMWKEYISHYRQALEHHPNNPELLGRLGEALINCPHPELKNVEEGKEFSERAFTHFNCPPDILVSSGSHLAFAYALTGNKPKAVETITKTITIGRREKIPQALQEKLENFYRMLQSM
ncbi:MAG: tetratricopeptide repeat protein [Mariniphaga sp.]|nr:tetratricopeptide repeat protein [Mariniphaga sp.]